jgi:hypothetical protein
VSERLKGRQRPTVVHHLLMDDDTAARAALALANQEWELSTLRTDTTPEATAAAKQAVADAQAAVDACYEPITMRALPPEVFEELAAQHPPRKDKEERWNDATFPRAVFLASVEGEMTEEEWVAFLDTQCSQGERTVLGIAALGVNARWPSGDIPKG